VPAEAEPGRIEALAATLGVELGERVTKGEAVRSQHARDEGYRHGAGPDLVVFPRSTEEVQFIVRSCADAAVPVVPWGAGTSLEGNAIAVAGGVVVDLSRMDRIVEVAPGDFTVRVQAGVRRKQLNRELRATGLFFPVDPGADATLGGMASTRASGTTAVRYGTMRSNVVNLTVVLADGEAIRTARNAPKSAAGYDLTALFVGAEGTLGIITELTLRLHPQPETAALVRCTFDDGEPAIEAVTAAIQLGLGVARIEFLDDRMVKAINLYQRLVLPELFTLFVEFHGSAGSVAEQLATFEEIVGAHGGTVSATATQSEERERLWTARHDALYAARALRPGCSCLITDVCVPVSRLAECLRETRGDLDASALVSTVVGHVGDGNFHALILVDPDAPADLEEAERLHSLMARRAIALGGTCTGEHGIGIGKRALLVEELGNAVGAMARVKAALDPAGLMNPGKIFLEG